MKKAANQNLLKKIKEKKAKIAVIGLGYVGLPLAILFTKSGFMVNGYIRNEKTAKSLSNGTSGIGIDKELQNALQKKKLSIYTTDSNTFAKNDVYIICVPTPVTKQKIPDLTSLKEVAQTLSQVDLTNKLIINESSVAPFTTKKILGNLAENYFLICSPERINPGSEKTVDAIAKVIGGINQESIELGMALYKQVIKGELVQVESMEVAEMSKMLENTSRAVNIALANEFAKLADSLNIDFLSVIAAAKTKWNFLPHYPGIGVGGHCIPVDPYYILQLAQKKNISMPVVSEGLATNEEMPTYIFDKIMAYYKKGMHVLVYGLTYKKNVLDLRESPVLTLCELLKKKKITFSVYDPFLVEQQITVLELPAGKLEKTDIFVVGTDHKELLEDFKLTVTERTIVIDGRNFFTKKVGKKVLGVGRSFS